MIFANKKIARAAKKYRSSSDYIKKYGKDAAPRDMRPPSARFANEKAYKDYVKKHEKDAAAGGSGGMRPPSAPRPINPFIVDIPGELPTPVVNPLGPGPDGKFKTYEEVYGPYKGSLNPVTVLPSKPGGVGTTGFKSGSGGFASNMFGTGMKKGGKVKAISAPKASSASKKADGVAIKGKTKGRFV